MSHGLPQVAWLGGGRLHAPHTRYSVNNSECWITEVPTGRKGEGEV